MEAINFYVQKKIIMVKILFSMIVLSGILVVEHSRNLEELDNDSTINEVLLNLSEKSMPSAMKVNFEMINGNLEKVEFCHETEMDESEALFSSRCYTGSLSDNSKVIVP